MWPSEILGRAFRFGCGCAFVAGVLCGAVATAFLFLLFS